MAGGSRGGGSGPVRTPGGVVELLADADRPGGWLLLIDRVRQSYVDLDDPGYLDFEYMQTFASIVDNLPPGRLRVTHIGGGALSFPRYVADRRPGSSQIVLEPNTAMTELVRTRLPLPRGSGIRVRAVDGLAGLGALADGSADLIVLDAFDGARVPAAFSSPRFVAEVARVLAPAGVFLANMADGRGSDYVRRYLAGLAPLLPHRVVVADSGVLKGRRFGNVILAASRAPLPVSELAAAAAVRMFPHTVYAGRDLASYVGRAAAFGEDDAVRSPAPPELAWRVHDIDGADPADDYEDEDDGGERA